MEGLCRAAQDYVQRATRVQVDLLALGEDSMAYVDHYLEQVRAQREPVGEELLDLIACALGALLGEVLIRKVGGRWRGPLPGEPGDEDHPANWRVELLPVPLTFAPVGMAAEAIRQGEVEGYYAGFTTAPAFAEELAEVLGRVPVTSEYYYSMTGRLETLTYAVEILADIQRQEREEEEEDGDRGDRDDEDAAGGAS